MFLVNPDEGVDFVHDLLYLILRHVDEELVRSLVQDSHLLELLPVSDHQRLGDEVQWPLAALLNSDLSPGLVKYIIMGGYFKAKSVFLMKINENEVFSSKISVKVCKLTFSH